MHPEGSEGHGGRGARVARDSIWQLPEAIYVATEGGEIVDANRAFLELVGLSSREALRTLSLAALWADPARRREQLDRLSRDGRVQQFEFELRRLDGEIRTVLDTCCVVGDSHSGERLSYGILVDISERSRREQELRGLLIRDPLTGCYNRRYLTELENKLQADAEGRWGVVVVDIDDFKQYNDAYGHQAGDEVLIRLARFLTHRIRPADTVVRLGGDEFVVLLFEEDADHTEEVVERFQQTGRLAAPVRFSLGWSLREAGERLEETIDRADRQLIHVRVQERRYRQRRRSVGGA